MAFLHLTLLTEKFPYGGAETFVAAELPHLVQVFDHVDIVPTARLLPEELQGPVRQLPGGMTLRRDITAYLAERRRAHDVVRSLEVLGDSDAARLIAHELIRPNAGAPAFFRRGARRLPRRAHHLMQYLGHALLVRDAFRRFGLRGPTYGFWLNAAVLGASLAGIERLVCRAHGADLYAEREPSLYLALQAATMARVRALYFISEHGRRYATARYPHLATRFRLARLGVPEPASLAAPSPPGAPLQLLTCAGLRPVKRMGLLVAALRMCRSRVHWTHLGDGPERPAVENAANELPSHMTFRLAGDVPHAEVMRFYRENMVDLFANVSVDEGVPVSIMEALAHGVPVLALDVGGNGELVHEGAGHLLAKGVSAAEIGRAIEDFEALSSESRHTLRTGARDTWSARADAAKVYASFCQDLAETLK